MVPRMRTFNSLGDGDFDTTDFDITDSDTTEWVVGVSKYMVKMETELTYFDYN